MSITTVTTVTFVTSLIYQGLPEYLTVTSPSFLSSIAKKGTDALCLKKHPYPFL